ncbi:hypothetical protein PILCRDRAFT_7041 [Piloderma croceum F 1598]|uniref:Uncharacterized protein n=1 Tax=Piloderma croceum (strain F 1598) TaxID=765440 RepID=A0A0C3BBH7_PILCF|nr:hypothetical protein PILCRDRAFT_7041 [Piloderma croceum F 1598]
MTFSQKRSSITSCEARTIPLSLTVVDAAKEEAKMLTQTSASDAEGRVAMHKVFDAPQFLSGPTSLPSYTYTFTEHPLFPTNIDPRSEERRRPLFDRYDKGSLSRPEKKCSNRMSLPNTNNPLVTSQRHYPLSNKAIFLKAKREPTSK